jgi:hypothetical protein
MKWEDQVASMGDIKDSYKKLSENISGRPRHRQKDVIYLWELGYEGMNWIQITQGKVQWWTFVIKVMNLQVS